ncbi:MAG: glycoside hydrolase family 3 N-terminal domain-containing protein [Rhizomicrobium sp.]|nr:glycoside hydrolase family 3 N-terminal domain-containing protein [Rhizomicrobium sp.]
MTDKLALTRRTLLACSILGLPYAAQGKTAAAPYRDPGAPLELRVRDLLGRMTLDEKVAQLCSMWMSKTAIMDGAGVFSPAKAVKSIPHGIGQIGRPNDTTGTTRANESGFRSTIETIAFVNAVQRYLLQHTRLGIPALFHVEGAHGFMGRDATIFPIPPGLASTFDPDLIEAAFTVTGREARANGGTVVLGPVLDLARDPRYGRVEEFFSEDPYLTGRMGTAAALGLQGRSRPLQKDRAFVTLKHFVHAVPQAGLNTAPADISERSLRETFLVPFAAAIKAANPASIMPSYNEVEGVPSHASKTLLRATGRELLGFKGVYFSDYTAIENLATQHHMAADLDEAAIIAINAGVDADLPEGEAYSRLAKLVRSGRLAETQLDASVSRILALKFEAGLFETPYLDPHQAEAQTNTPSDIALARKVAEKSVTLLKNDGILPLDPSAALKLAVIGPNSVKPLLGGYSGTNDKAIGILDGIKAAAGPQLSVEQADGAWIINPTPHDLPYRPANSASKTENQARIAEAVAVAQRSDVVLLVVGDRPEVTREAVMMAAPGDRETLNLFGDQDALVEAIIATGKPIIALLLNGRALTVTRLAEKSRALLEGWYLGQEGGHAFADVFFGKANPGGKLPVSFPRSVGSLPIFYNRHPSADSNQYIEGKHEPLFPFGHGLSYTTFDISAPRLVKPDITVGETAVVSVDVKNTGTRTGDEVVQLYIRDDVSSVPRPVLELRGFQRVTLAPGETRTLTFDLPPDALAFWDIDMRFRVEPGSFTISCGASSAALKSVTLKVA